MNLSEVAMPWFVELEKRKALYRAREQEALRALVAAAVDGDRITAQLQLEKLIAYADLRQLAESYSLRVDDNDAARTYLVGSLFLHECHKVLVQGPDERMHYVTGLQLGSILTLDTIVPFDLDEASPVFAKGNLASSHAELVRLDRFGHRLHGLFHRHPGKGKDATRPSSIDLDTQERQERGKYPVVGAIFTEDGYVRFFSAGNKFDLITHGEGVQHVEGTIYRLTQIG